MPLRQQQGNTDLGQHAAGSVINARHEQVRGGRASGSPAHGPSAARGAGRRRSAWGAFSVGGSL